jgi:hypothetical protein
MPGLCFFPTKVRHLHSFFDSIYGRPCRKMAAAAESSTCFQHGWRNVQQANWHQIIPCAERATCADRKRDAQKPSKRQAKTRHRRSARQILRNGRPNARHALGELDMPRHQNLAKILLTIMTVLHQLRYEGRICTPPTTSSVQKGARQRKLDMIQRGQTTRTVISWMRPQECIRWRHLAKQNKETSTPSMPREEMQPQGNLEVK